MKRRTYALINDDILENNIKEIVNNYKYDYYIGVVKNNSYHHGIETIKSLIKGGINYLAVSSIEEAISIRKYDNNIPILCLEPINLDLIDDILKYNITITIEDNNYLKELNNIKLNKTIKIHLAIDSGMNRIGYSSSNDLLDAIKLIKSNKYLYLEGIYTHFATSGVADPYWDIQLNNFKNITSSIDLSKIPIVHLGRSLTLVEHDRIPFANGIRLGICMYGFAQSYKVDNSIRGKLRNIKINYLKKKYNCSKTTTHNNLKLNTAFSLYTEVMSKRKVYKGEVVGYNTYKVESDGYILTLPIGYADGVDIRYKVVSINNKLYNIVSDCMDMIMVYSKDDIKVGTTVEIFGNNISIRSVCNNLHINSYHLFNLISNRVLRVHIHGNTKEQIYY